MEGPSTANKSERIWDPLVRLFHWSLVVAFATAWLGRGEAFVHDTAGKIVFGLIIFRTVWGVIGTGAARFDTFLRGPRATLAYVYDIVRGRPAHYSGHNPAGAAMIIMMMLALTVTTASGILMTTTKLWGNGTIEFIHGQSANLMLVLIAGHLLGVLAASLQHRENLAVSMVTGWKSVPPDTLPYHGNVRWSARHLFLAVLIIGGSLGIWQASTFALNASYWRMEKIIAAKAKQAGCTVVHTTGPEIVVHPHIEFRYATFLVGKAEAVEIPVSGRLVMERKPDAHFPALSAACEHFKAATLASRPVAASTGTVERPPLAKSAAPDSARDSSRVSGQATQAITLLDLPSREAARTNAQRRLTVPDPRKYTEQKKRKRKRKGRRYSVVVSPVPGHHSLVRMSRELNSMYKLERAGTFRASDPNSAVRNSKSGSSSPGSGNPKSGNSGSGGSVKGSSGGSSNSGKG